jgi:glutamate/aspartate transport system substrate-binding protein
MDVVEVTSSTREGMLLDGRIDIECGSTTITEERLARHAFSRPIFHTSQRVAVKGGLSRPRSGPLRVTGISGSTSQRALERDPHLGFTFTFAGVPSIGDAWNMFRRDENVDAIVADEVILRSLLADGAESLGAELLDSRLGEESYGFMMRHEDCGLRNAVNMALDEILRSAGHRDICRRWFSAELPGLAFSLGMNAADVALASR